MSIENETLTCFHFHALKMINKNTALVPEGYTFMNRSIRNHIYIPYIHALMEAISQVENAGHQIPYKLDRSDALLLAYNLLRGRWSLNVIRV